MFEDEDEDEDIWSDSAIQWHSDFVTHWETLIMTVRVSDWLTESDRICSSYDVFLDSFTKLSDRLFRLNLDYCFLKLRNPGVVFSFCPGKLSLLIFCFAPTFLKRCQHISDKTASAGSPAACYNDILNICASPWKYCVFQQKILP